MTEFDPRHFPEKEEAASSRLPQTLGRAAMHAYIGLRTKRNRLPTLYRTIEEEAIDSPQPTHPDVASTVYGIKKVLAKHSILPPDNLSISDKFIRSMQMIQFTNHFSSRDQAFFDYSTMEELKNRFTASAKQQAHPLGFDQQLDIALELSDGDMLEGLTSLWLTSRQYARWFDGISIRDLPDFTPDEIMTEMKDWQSSILACKPLEGIDFQDTAGDSYYAWTHALARVIYGSGSSVSDRIGKYIFSRGTDIMHTGVHSFIKQSVPSNHRIAAEYGNRIGDTILEAIQAK